MMRILLVTEGPSDEPVAESLVRRTFREARVDRKRFSRRGFEVVARQIEIWVRAAHFGHYDLLVIHFDLDDSISGDFEDVSESERWREVRSAAKSIREILPSAGRKRDLRVALMTPCQSTEAWLVWGVEDKDGRHWERTDRRQLKRRLFGNPPRGLVEKAELLADELLDQMKVNRKWPRSLRSFVTHLGEGDW